MFCPNCAAQVDGMKFCRQCGANVSLVPQALTGQLPAAAPPPEAQMMFDHRGRRRRRHGPPTMEGAAREFFSGFGFLLVALAIWQFFPGGFAWWFWLLIPAFGAMGKGIGQYFAVREQLRISAPPPQPYYAAPSMPPAPPQPQFPVPTTSELKLPASVVPPPASVTEHTTALLNRERAAQKESDAK